MEAVGEAVTGAMTARAIEPEAGELPNGAHPESCLNCGTRLIGSHCHDCGQAGHVHRTVGAWWHDVAHSVLHFEGKLWRTLPLLALRPGELTRRYVDGERARFVSPMAFFLFTVFLMFAAFGALSVPLIDLGSGEETAVVTPALDARIAQLEQQVERELGAGRATGQLEQSLVQARAERTRILTTDRPQFIGGNIDTGWERLDHGLKKASENPQLLAYKLQSSAYKYSWALIPLSLPFLWALFLHRRRYREQFKAYDHLVFITYSIGFMSLLLIALVLLSATGLPLGLLSFALVLAVPVHIYRQLKGAYRLSGLSALWRTVAVLFAASLAITLFSTLLVGLGLLA